MISSINIKNLKSFENVSLETNNFTLLVGMNSSGKSTIIQSILLAMQNVTEKGRSPLNGKLVSLGQFSDARNFITNAKYFSVKLISEEIDEIRLDFSQDIDNSVVCSIDSKNEIISEYLNQKNKKIHYISSKRIGSQDTYLENFDAYNDYGILGEYSIDYFEKNKNKPVQKYLIKDKNQGITLQIQVNYWLSYIVNSELSTEDIVGTDQVRAQFKSQDNRQVRPRNIGSGLSYIISILISSLSSEANELIIIENPEIHLHPRAQSRLTEFLAFTAENGIKYIIETHSDHIFNGIRKSISKNQISLKNVSVHYLRIDEEKLNSISTKIEFNVKGDVLNHQNGLFDQFDDDLDTLLRL
jgi:predicted ATPase